jgi:acylphosphatase
LRVLRTERALAVEAGLEESDLMSDDLIRRKVTSHGRVQGVFFRDSTRERAKTHGVAGWVRNTADGAVEAVLEGPPEAVDRVTRFLETGPPSADVQSTDVDEQEPEGLSGFEIR